MTWRYRCPGCMSASISRRVTLGDYRCDICREVFEEPVDMQAAPLSF